MGRETGPGRDDRIHHLWVLTSPAPDDVALEIAPSSEPPALLLLACMTLGGSVRSLALECLPLGFPGVAPLAKEPPVILRQLGAVSFRRGAARPLRHDMINLAIRLGDSFAARLAVACRPCENFRFDYKGELNARGAQSAVRGLAPSG